MNGHEPDAGAHGNTIKRGRGQSIGPPAHTQRHYPPNVQSARIDATTRDSSISAMPLSPPPMQRAFIHQPVEQMNHNRQVYSLTDNSSMRSQDSTLPSNSVTSPSLRSVNTDRALSPPTMTPAHFGTTPSPPAAPLSTAHSRTDTSVSPLPTSSASTQRSATKRHASRARNEASVKAKDGGDERSTVADFALEHLFSRFVLDADRKINDIISPIAKSRLSDNIQDVCGPGVDRGFDKLLTALSHVSSSRPEPLVNKLVAWKISHDEAASATAAAKAPSVPSSVKPSIDLSKPSSDFPPSSRPSQITTSTQMSRPDVAMSERRASTATYLLCRALSEVLSRTTLPDLGHQVAMRLEEILFDGHVSKISFEEIHRSSLQSAKWEKATDVLGILSRLDFGGVFGRYLEMLKACRPVLETKGAVHSEVQNRAHMVLKGMCKLLPHGDQSKYFIEFNSCLGELISLFVNVHGESIKSRFCQVFDKLLVCLAGNVRAELEDSKWRRNLTTLQDRLLKLSSKNKYRDAAYPALVALACVSPNDMFQARWQNLPNTLSLRFKEGRGRGTILKGACRLTWTFLHRTSTTDSVSRAMLDDIVKSIFFSKKYIFPREFSIHGPLVEFVRVVAQFDPEYAFRKIIFPLVQEDLFKGPRNPERQSLDTDKIIIGIHAFLAVVENLESGQHRTFPASFTDEQEESGDAEPPPMSPSFSDLKSSRRLGSAVSGDRLSHPVPAHTFSAPIRDSYNKFCELLSRILTVCDNAFGGQPSSDERSAPSNTSRGQPMIDAWFSARHDDEVTYGERVSRTGFLDLLHVTVKAIPRCLSKHTPIKQVVDLLCTGTAHTEENIAASSAASLQAIARQGYAELISSRFSFFIFRQETKYYNVADAGLLGPSQIETTLKLWVELLNIWERELLQVAKQSDDGSGRLNASNSKTHVDRVESQGLFLLCSPSSYVRSNALNLLSIVTRLDKALGEDVPRIHGILTGKSSPLFPPSLEHREAEFSSVERAKLDMFSLPKNIGHTFLDLCGSDSSDDAAMWYKLFPDFIRCALEVCMTSVVQTREDVSHQLNRIQAHIDHFPEERQRAPTMGSVDNGVNRGTSRTQNSPSSSVIEQYKLYLVFLCATIQKQDSSLQPTTPESSHARKISRSSTTGSDCFDTAQNLFGTIVPMIYSDNFELRRAAVVGLSSINPGLYQLLLQSLGAQSQSLNVETRAHYTHSRNASSPRRAPNHPVYRQELVEIYERTSHFLIDFPSARTETAMNHLAEFTWSLYEYLRPDEMTFNASTVRRYYCGVVQNFYLATTCCENPTRWMPFAKRKAHFIKFEEWFIEVTPSEGRGAAKLPQSPHGRGGFQPADRAAAVWNEQMRAATSNAMAALCTGPFQAPKPEPDGQFNLGRLLAWTDKLFSLDGDKYQATGKKALTNLISSNKGTLRIVESVIAKLFHAGKTSTIETYLDVLLEMLTQPDPPQMRDHRLVGTLLFTLGHIDSSVRAKSVRMLRIHEELARGDSSLRAYDISVSDRTGAVYQKAQFEISTDFANHRMDSYYACCIFSLYAEHFVGLRPDSQRSIVRILLPWMPHMSLDKDSKYGYTAPTYVVLLNLIDITTHCNTSLQNEMQAIWQALARPVGNTRCILDFIVDLSLQKGDQKFIRLAKQIVVFLATANTEEGPNVDDFLLHQIAPPKMNASGPSMRVQIPEGVRDFPYVVDQGSLFPDPPPQVSLSIGQLALIFLVDLVVDDAAVSIEKLPELLQVILVLWDYHSAVVQEQAREMLVHLVHVFVISKADSASVSRRDPSIEELVELIRRQDAKVGWQYIDNSEPDSPAELPNAMQYVISEALALFSLTIPGIHEKWGKMALTWALICPVRHIACRSLQIYQHILQPLGQHEFCEILNRLAVSIADPGREYQAYAMDVLRTIHAVVRRQPPESLLLPQAFWAVCAALDSSHEWEYGAAISTLRDILDRIDLVNPHTVATLEASRPTAWQGSIVDSFMPALFKGCSSRSTCDNSISLINRALHITCHPSYSNERCLQLGVIANLPSLLLSYENPAARLSANETASALSGFCALMGYSDLSDAFDGFSTARLPRDSFVSSCLSAMRSSLLATVQYDVVEFLMRQLLNPLPWMRSGALRIAKDLLPRIDQSDARIKSKGLDLFSPLVNLLRTEYFQDALQVIDHVLALTGTSRDLQQLRTSHASYNPLRPPSKPSADIGSLFGGCTPTGWPAQDPLINKSRIRSRIDDLASAHQRRADSSSQMTLTPEVEFQKEEPFNDSYFPTAAVQESTVEISISADYDTHISQVTAQLDDLDDFFEDNNSETAVESETSSFSTMRPLRKEYSRPLHQSKPSVTQPVTPRSHRKLDSTASFSTEFLNGSLNASPALPPQAMPQPPVPPMSPSAFASPPSSESRPPTRPGMPPRAVTMPVSNLETTPPEKAIPKPTIEPEPFSDDEFSTGRIHTDRTDSGTASRANTPQKPFSSLRNSIKRAMGGGERHRRTNTRAQVSPSPQVPPVPNEYLPTLPNQQL